MKIMEIKHQPNGIIMEWVIGLTGLFFLIVVYALMMPIGNVLIQVFVENGTPIAQLLFIRQMVIWELVLIGGMLITWSFMSSYRKTFDSGEFNGYR